MGDLRKMQSNDVEHCQYCGEPVDENGQNGYCEQCWDEVGSKEE